ncbi:Scr1 family TA system antitoxin-like transcriptional regulator [Embleya scabrispora]|uniref:Scr1 family TA system antitoxin-like transcriptional regulator n=1 Tax=Embleya scabrispora TaxID=159449 RepID=UPI003CCC1A1F
MSLPYLTKRSSGARWVGRPFCANSSKPSCPLLDTSRTLLRVAPLARGAHAALGAPLILLGLADGGQAAYQEGLVNGQLVEDPDAVRARRRSYDRVSADALTPGESAALITAVIKECKS